MSRRFPQPVRVGDLIGLPVLDRQRFDARLCPAGRAHAAGQDRTHRRLQRWFGWFGWIARPVAVPIEAVGIVGRQLASLDMPRERIRRRADLARARRDGAGRRCDRSAMALARRLNPRSRLCEADNFLVSARLVGCEAEVIGARRHFGKRAIVALHELIRGHRMDRAGPIERRVDFSAGNSAVRLACGIAFMAKASAPGRAKTRLVPPLTFDEAAALNTAFLARRRRQCAARRTPRRAARAALPAMRPTVRRARRTSSATPCRARSA